LKLGSRSKTLSFIAAGIVAFFWASSFPAVRYAVQYYSPEAIMLARFLIASVLLLGYCALKKLPPPAKRDLPLFLAAGLLGLFVYMWAFITGTRFVSAGISSFIISSAPIFTLILSIVFLKEKAGFLIWIGVLISFAGLAMISFAQSGEVQLNIGIPLLLLASVSTSIFTIIQRRLLLTYTALQSSAYSFGFATLCMCIFFPILVREFPSAPISANLIIVYLGVFPAAIAYFLWSFALSKAEKTIHVTSFMYIIPFLASILAFLWLGEEISVAALLGGVIITAGMIITNFIQKKHLS